MNNHDQCKAYAATCVPLTAERRAKAKAKADQLKRAQADPDPHRDVVMLRRRRTVDWVRGLKRHKPYAGVYGKHH